MNIFYFGDSSRFLSRAGHGEQRAIVVQRVKRSGSSGLWLLHAVRRHRVSRIFIAIELSGGRKDGLYIFHVRQLSSMLDLISSTEDLHKDLVESYYPLFCG